MKHLKLLFVGSQASVDPNRLNLVPSKLRTVFELHFVIELADDMLCEID